MSEEQVSVASRRRSRAEAEQLAREFEASGLSRGEFCRDRGLSVSTLDGYRARLRRTQAAAGDRFVAVEVAGRIARTGASASGVALVLANERRIEVNRGFDAAALVQLLSLLDRV